MHTTAIGKELMGRFILQAVPLVSARQTNERLPNSLHLHFMHVGLRRLHTQRDCTMAICMPGINNLFAADTTAPVAACPSDQVIDATSANGAAATYVPLATDNVEVASITCSPASGDAFAPSTTHAVWCLASDTSGNSNACQFSITVGTTLWLDIVA